MDALSPVMRKVVAVAVLAAVVGAFLLIVVQPVVTRFTAYGETIDRSRDLLARYERLGNSRPELEAQLVQLRKAQASAGGFLEGASVELAAATLQNKIKTVIKESGGNLRSTQILRVEDDADGLFRRVGVRVTMTGTVESLHEVFYALETSVPYLFLENIDIRGRRSQNARKKVANAAVLQVRYNAYGYMEVEVP